MEIAVHVGRSEPTIRREFRRGGGRGFYAARTAQTDADTKARRGKVPKLVSDPGLAGEVTESLEWRWSPHAIGAYLREESPNRRVSAETIYQACYNPRPGVFRRVPGSCCPVGVPAAGPVAAVNRPNATSWVTSEG